MYFKTESAKAKRAAYIPPIALEVLFGQFIT